MKQYDRDDHSNSHINELIEEKLEDGCWNFHRRKNDPVGEVTYIVFLISTFQGNKREVGWNQVTNYAD